MATSYVFCISMSYRGFDNQRTVVQLLKLEVQLSLACAAGTREGAGDIESYFLFYIVLFKCPTLALTMR